MTLDDDLKQNTFGAKFKVKNIISKFEQLSEYSKNASYSKKNIPIQNGNATNEEKSRTNGKSLSERENSDFIEKSDRMKENSFISSEETDCKEATTKFLISTNDNSCYDPERNGQVKENTDGERVKDSCNSSIKDSCDTESLISSNLNFAEESEIDLKDLCDSDKMISNNSNSEADSRHSYDTDLLNLSPPVSEDESEIDSSDCSSPPPVLMRPAFKPRARMFKAVAPEAPPSQYIMDVPEMWGVGADGSMMEVFNKLEIKE